MSHFFASGGQSFAALGSAAVHPVDVQDWFPLGWTGLISLQPNAFSRVFSNTTAQKHQFFGAQLSLGSNSHIHTWLLEKPLLWLIWTFVRKVMSLLFNMLSYFTVSIVSPSICHDVIGPDAMNLVFWVLSFKPTFSLSSSPSRDPLVPLCFLP